MVAGARDKSVGENQTRTKTSDPAIFNLNTPAAENLAANIQFILRHKLKLVLEYRRQQRCSQNLYGNKLVSGGKSAHKSASFSSPPNPLLAGRKVALYHRWNLALAYFLIGRLRRCVSYYKKDFVTIRTLIHGPSVPVNVVNRWFIRSQAALLVEWRAPPYSFLLSGGMYASTSYHENGVLTSLYVGCVCDQ